MENLINSLEENLKELYRKAIDADAQIDALKAQGHGKFETIFKSDAPFQAEAKKFMPYLEETAEEILAIKESGLDAEQNKQQIEQVVVKLHQLHKTIAEFNQAVK